jgi:uncharacterized protein (TIGR02147 family)
MAYRDYRTYLKSVLENRVSSNPGYSLRAFARDLKVSPQMLSFVLNERKGISTEVAAEIAERLNMSPAETSYFVDLVTLAHARNAQVKRLAQYRIDERLSQGPSFKTLEVEAFQAISDWHHYAILELTFVPGFKSDPKWIAGQLGITAFEASQAIERLQKLELLDARDGELRKTELNISASYGTPSSALRKLAKQLLEKAIESLETQSIDERDVTNITMAIDPALLPEAKKMISDFRRKLCGFLEQGNRSEVYVFAPALFRASRIGKRRNGL